MAAPNLLSMLLGRQATDILRNGRMAQEAPTPVAGLLPPAEEAVSEIQVTANRPEVPAAPVDKYADFLIGNRDAVQEAARANKLAQEYSERRGMFGTKGTLRDILGVLGDSFLVQSGNKAIYMPQREKEKLADAMIGFSVDPRAAAERAAYIDPATGRQLLVDAETSELKEAQLQSLEDYRDDMSFNRKYNQLKDARGFAQAILAQPGAYGPDGNLSPAAEQALKVAATQAGVGVEELVGEGTDPNTLRMIGQAGMTVNQQRNLPLNERRVVVAERNATSGETRARASMISAQRPRAAPQRRAETQDERYTRIADTPVSNRSIGDQEWYTQQKRIREKQGESRRRRNGNSPANQSTNRGWTIRPRSQ